MSKLLITATKVIAPDGKVLDNFNKVVFVESDKITILPTAGETKSVLVANGYQYFLDAEPTELGTALGAENVSSYT